MSNSSFQEYEGTITNGKDDEYDWFATLIHGAARDYRTRYTTVKRIFDFSVVILMAPAWLPLFLVCAILIKLQDPGAPVIFRQERTGLNGTRFTLYKFRTMVRSAEAMKQELIGRSQLGWPDFKIKDDPRITPLGRFLRKASLDEIPQLLNVLKGDMSLVGPRPTSFPVEHYKPWQRDRLSVLPGITGLSQVVNRDGMEFDNRVRFDLAYVRNRCLILDLLILIRTFNALFRGH